MAEPLQRRDDGQGGKYYEHPTLTEIVDGVERPARYISVTTALSVVDKPALKYWSAKLAARRAYDNLPLLTAHAFAKPCEQTWKRPKLEPGQPHPRCGACRDCLQRWVELYHEGETARRAREGSALHDVLEHWTKTGIWLYEPDRYRTDTDEPPSVEVMQAYMGHLQRFIEEYGLTPESWFFCECTVYSHRWKYAGTLDGVVDFTPTTRKAHEFCARISGQKDPGAVRIILDLKTREGEEAQFYTEHPLQLAPYRWAEVAMPKGAAVEVTMPETDGAAILQVRPDAYAIRPVVADGATFAAFRSALELYRWTSDEGRRATLAGAFPKPDGYVWPPVGPEPFTGINSATMVDVPEAKPRKRAPAKRAAKAAARVANATLESIARTGAGPAYTIPDDEIPF